MEIQRLHKCRRVKGPFVEMDRKIKYFIQCGRTPCMEKASAGKRICLVGKASLHQWYQLISVSVVNI